MSKLATIPMRDEDWDSLVHAIHKGTCILMLGPDALRVSYDGEVVPVHIGLAAYVKERLDPKYKHLDTSQPSAIAQVAVHEEDLHILQRWVRGFYQVTEPFSPILEDLASLPFPLIVNTSPVIDIGSAFSRVKQRTVVGHYDRTGPSAGEPADPSQDAPLVYNLYGSLEHPDSIVISELDRLEFLVSIITDSPQLPKKIRSALRNERTSFLFVGFSFGQWQLRLLLHVLAKAARRINSFALELEPDQVDPETALFYKNGHRIQFPEIPLDDFIGELRTRMGPMESASSVADVPPPDAPKVFLCHASEDKAHAEQLRLVLRQNGIDAWLDKEDLRGGDRWDDVIKAAIKSEVDYVAILQSENLARKTAGYVNKEIHLALERQLEFRGRTFIIPVRLDETEVLPELAAFQSIDLRTEGGADHLVRAIRRDLNRQRRVL